MLSFFLLYEAVCINLYSISLHLLISAMILWTFLIICTMSPPHPHNQYRLYQAPPHPHVVVDGVGGSDDGAAGPLPICKVDISNEKHHKLTSTSSG